MYLDFIAIKTNDKKERDKNLKRLNKKNKITVRDKDRNI